MCAVLPEGTDVHIQQHNHQKDLNLCLSLYYFGRVIVELEKYTNKDFTMMLLKNSFIALPSLSMWNRYSKAFHKLSKNMPSIKQGKESHDGISISCYHCFISTINTKIVWNDARLSDESRWRKECLSECRKSETVRQILVFIPEETKKTLNLESVSFLETGNCACKSFETKTNSHFLCFLRMMRSLFMGYKAI